ncbi:hypothetical protein M8C21_018948, partial [Ambrosia artemisiifolia]
MAASTLSHWPSIKLKSLQLPQNTRYLNNTSITRTCLALSVKASSSSLVKKNNNPVIVIDNYDSFTYNLCQEFVGVPFVPFIFQLFHSINFEYIGELGCNFEVYRNDEITVEELNKGISVPTILELGPTVPLFGVCLGLQCIGEAFGGIIVRSPSGAVLGKSSLVYYKEDGEQGLFAGLSNPFAAARYHRFVIDKETFPSDALEITAWTEDGLIMAARHKVYTHLQGVQFHPESIITDEGKKIVSNFIKLIENMEADSQ